MSKDVKPVDTSVPVLAIPAKFAVLLGVAVSKHEASVAREMKAKPRFSQVYEAEMAEIRELRSFLIVK